MRGRPLAFLMLVVGGWATARVLVLLPDEVIRPLTLASRDLLIAPAAAETSNWSAARPRPATGDPIIGISSSTRPPSVAIRQTEAPRMAVMATNPGLAAIEPAESLGVLAPIGLPAIPPATRRASRWSGSGWAIVRDGGGGSLLSPLLGGSQAGIRVAYRLDDHRRTALFARLASPLKDGPAELAAGAQWRPGAAPVTLYAEVRATKGRAAPAAGVFGGGAVALPADFRLEGYGQAGVIRRDGVSAFGDAQVRLARRIGPVEAGAGAWAAAQRGASRIDIGPSLALPIAADPLALRVTLDWRHRIAGNARPASGPVLSLGTDF